MTNQTLPDWMMREEITEERHEVKNSFLQSNLSTVISLLSYLKIENRKKYDDSPVIRICELIILLILIYNSKSILFYGQSESFSWRRLFFSAVGR